MSRSKKFLYTGDTGFCDTEYRKIGEKFGPFDLAAIPIGAYLPRFFLLSYKPIHFREVMQSQHIDPKEAVEVHKLIKSKFSLGIHWGTYLMGSYEVTPLLFHL